MLVSLNWMKEYMDCDAPVEDIAAKLTMTGSEVDGWEQQGTDLNKVVIGKLVSVEKHPNADKLSVCMVDVGGEENLQIVCGADNIYEGALVPVALPKANLPCGLKIKKGKIRGVKSAGMLCSGEELNITEEMYPGAGVYGIMLIKEDASPGDELAKVLGMDDIILDIGLTANRPDCQSVVGMARETAAIMGANFKMPSLEYTEQGGDINDHLTVEVLDPVRCPRYTARMIKNVKIGPSPAWMAKSLIAMGVRPINNIVDITNYVMLEMGQPMHAFDLNDMNEGIVVRLAKKGESVVTLDDKQRAFKDDMLVIADKQVPTAIAGVMGGAGSGIHDDTNMVLFESANFLASSIRRTARTLGMRTDASSRYEKGLDPANTMTAVNRALSLVEQLGVGEVVAGVIDVCNTNVEPRELVVKKAPIDNLLGQEIPIEEMAKILSSLYIETKIVGDELHCIIPTYRADIEGSADLAEEIQRIYGYNTIPSTKLMTPNTGSRTMQQKIRMQIQDTVTGWGFYEAYTYSFISPSALDKLQIPMDSDLRKGVVIANPLGEDYSFMRTTLAPGILQSVANNINQRETSVKLFEVGMTYHPKALPVVELPTETSRICLGIMEDGCDFYTIKGMVEGLLKNLHIHEYDFTQEGPSWMHPGRKATLMLGDAEVGYVGEVHPDTATAFGIKHRVYIAELSIDILIKHYKPSVEIKPVAKFPASNRDLAVVVDDSQNVGPMLKTIRTAGGRILESASVFDIYRSDALGKDKKSVAFSMTFRSATRTLEEGEVNKQFDRILKKLSAEYGAEIRS